MENETGKPVAVVSEGDPLRLAGATAKCVVIVSEDQPLGLMVNTASVLTFTLGHRMGEFIGPDVQDASDDIHPGIIKIPIPILKASPEVLRELRAKALETKQVFVVDFTDVAQSCKTYDEFIQKMLLVSEDQLTYIGIALCGEKKVLNKLTGNLPLVK